MDRQQLLALYQWSSGVCFRHRGRGVIDTTVVKTLHLPGNVQREVRACQECVDAMEAIRRERAQAAGSEYLPGRAGEELR